jgi:digeranylgeranylglycerophospholipid reductase
MAGVARPLPKDEIYACAQFLVSEPGEGPPSEDRGPWDVVEHAADFLVGNRVAPGGYAWSFPKGPGRWNVGVAITPADAAEGAEMNALNPTAIVRGFLASRRPGARILGYVVGAIPAPASPGPFAADGLLFAGDAGRLTEPLSGAGIAIAMESGVFAAEAAAEAIGRGDRSARGLKRYEERWRDERGREVAFYARARAFFRRLGDRDLDRVGRALARVLEDRFDPGAISAFDLGRSLVTADPRLLLLGRHLLAA